MGNTISLCFKPPRDDLEEVQSTDYHDPSAEEGIKEILTDPAPIGGPPPVEDEPHRRDAAVQAGDENYRIRPIVESAGFPIMLSGSEDYVTPYVRPSWEMVWLASRGVQVGGYLDEMLQKVYDWLVDPNFPSEPGIYDDWALFFAVAFVQCKADTVAKFKT